MRNHIGIFGSLSPLGKSLACSVNASRLFQVWADANFVQAKIEPTICPGCKRELELDDIEFNATEGCIFDVVTENCRHCGAILSYEEENYGNDYP